MVKSRFSSLDVRAMVNSIRPSIVGCKLTNIYDINSKVYLLKFSRKNFKCFLLLESGMRFHLTSYTRDKSSVPSNYTMKLRKHLRTRRLTSIEQLGCDRAIDLHFGKGEGSFHLILELYVSGNLIMTDHEYRIITVLRGHVGAGGEGKIAPRQVYPLEQATGLLLVPLEEFVDKLDEYLEKSRSRQENQEIQEIENEDAKALQAGSKVESAFAKRSKKRVQHEALPLAVLLQKLAPFADPALAARCIARAMAADGRPCPKPFQVNVDDMSFDEALSTLKAAATLLLDTMRSVSRPGDLGGGNMAELLAPAEGEELEDVDDGDEEDADNDVAKEGEGDGAKGPEGDAVKGVGASETPQVTAGGPDEPLIPGWVLRKRVHVPPAEPRWANDEFTPLCPDASRAPEEEALVHYATFHQCVDEFFMQLEEHKLVEQKAMHAQSVYAKVEKIRVDQGRRVEVLEGEQAAAERQALLIEDNVELVSRVLDMMNTMLASQVDWGELWRELKRQQRLGHPIAEHIHSVDLQRNEVKLLLSEQQDEDGTEQEQDDEDEEDKPMEVVPLDLNLSARANVARLHSRRKETRDKTSRTLTQAENAVKQAEKKAEKDLKKFELKQTIRKVRQTWWFEKFIWFISSENYLVLAARDGNQTEQLFSKYLGPQDIFVHADVAGAMPCFIKNPGGSEVPPATLCEAGTTALCHSSAWDKHIVISPWWITMDAVTRGTAPSTGDYVVVDGGFFVQGHRRFTPHLHLEMGITLLFHVGESSRARHKGERRSRYLEAIGRSEVVGEAAPGTDEAREEPAPLEPAVAEEPAGAAEADAAEGAEGAEAAEGEEEAASDDPEEAAEDAAEEAAEEGPAAEEGSAAAEEARSGGARGARARMSKAERRKLQKGGAAGGQATEEGAEGAEQPSGQGADQDAKPPKVAKAEASKAAPAVKVPRGQQSKLKRMKEKYRDQDDEERELRLAVLGSKATRRAGNAPAGQPGQPAAPAEAIEDAPADVDGDAAASGSKGGKGRGRGRGQAQERAPAEVVRAGCDTDADASALLGQLQQLDLLTGQPTAEDEVLYVLPMVAPYTALSGPYAHRVKLSPGNVKKGQVARQCLKIFEGQVSRPAWRQLVQAIPENEAASMLCGSCKLSMPGLQKLQEKMKQDKKKQQQQQQRRSE